MCPLSLVTVFRQSRQSRITVLSVSSVSSVPSSWVLASDDETGSSDAPQVPISGNWNSGSWPSPDEEGAEESGVAANGCLAVREHDAVDEEANKVRDRVRRCKLLDSALARSCFRLVAYLVIW